MRIISIANQKGGCGKTTTAINLASALVSNGKRVLLLDLDPQAHASLGLGIESQDSIYNVISKLTPRRLKIADIIRNLEENFDLIPSNILVGTLEQELADEIGRELKLIEVINPIKGQYDYILIDCPPNLGFLTVNALRSNDEVIIPMETSRFSLQGVERLNDVVQLIQNRLNHPMVLRVLVTMFDSRLRHSFSMLSEIKERFGNMLFDTMIHVNVKLKESVVLGKTVFQYDKYSRGAKDYFSLARELLIKAQDIEDAAGTFSPQMKELIKEETSRLIPITFSFDDPVAQSVYVTGSFNGWSLDEIYRMKKENNRWVLRFPLPQGVYRYRFIVDGKWQEDPQNPLQECNPFGDINSLIEVR